MIKRARIIGAAILIPLAFVGFLSCRKNAAQNTALEVSGVIEAIKIEVRSQSQGLVDEVLVREGQKVAKGDLLCRINADKLRTQMDQADAGIAAAEARVALARRGTKKELIAVAKSQVDVAAKQLETAERDQGRLAKLLSQEAVSPSQKEKADLALKAAQEQHKSAQENYQMALRGLEKEEIAMAEADLKNLRAQRRLLEQHLADTEVRAPGPGTVEVRQVEPGELVGPGTALFSLIDLGRTYVKAYVPENSIGRLSLGSEVAVTCDSFPGRIFSGTIGLISDEAEFAPKNIQTKEERLKLVYMIKSDLPNADGTLKPGMPVDVRIPLK
jgi:HlyD family secretion protein